MAVCSNICLKGGINGMCDTSMGGIVEVAITNWAENLFTYNATEAKVGTVTASQEGGQCDSSTDWYKFTFRKGTGTMTSTLNVDDANGVTYVSTELALQFAKMETAKRVEIMSLVQAPVAIVVKDANGKYWALGYNEPVTVSAGEGATGQARGDSNHYSITLLDNSLEMPYEVENGDVILNAAIF